MKREVPAGDLEKLYTANDMVKVCSGCGGCSECCRGMGESVILDPLDVRRLQAALGKDFSELSQQCLELNVVDGVILPNLRMAGEREQCVFLDARGRCSIHAHRPGFCRMFPLGRYYHDGTFSYFLQRGECRTEPKTKVKISRWIDMPDGKRYERYVLDWHNFLESVQTLLEHEKEEQLARDLNVYILEQFYAAPYTADDFYGQFEERLKKVKKLMKIIAKQ